MADTPTTYSTVDSLPRHWALFSGGHDSLVTTHYLMENGYTEAVLHLDTNTGIEENEEYVKNICEEYGWPLRIEQAPVTLREFALELGSDAKSYGFPGPEFHSIAYRMFKARQLENIAAETNGKPHYWTGVRKAESERRMRTVSDAVKETNRLVWHAPIRHWTDDRLERYIEEYDIPRNKVVGNMHRSGECFCGAFDIRDEALIDLEANYPEHYEWLMALETDVIESIGKHDECAYWAHGEVQDTDMAHLKDLREPDGPVLCQDCRMRNQNPANDW